MGGLDEDPWDVLGLAPGADEAAIRRAYAEAIHRHRPDEDAVAFQRLRSAYELLRASTPRAAPAAPPPHAVAPSTGDGVFHLDEINDPQRAAMQQWQRFRARCVELDHGVPKGGWRPLGPALVAARTALRAVLKDPALDAINAREEFHRIALYHCLNSDALALERIACLEVLGWQADRFRYAALRGPEAQAAIDRALADQQFDQLLAKGPGVLDAFLDGGARPTLGQRIRPRQAARLRDVLRQARAHMPQALHYHLGEAKVAAWLDALVPRWPHWTEVAVASYIGLVLAWFGTPALAAWLGGGMLPQERELNLAMGLLALSPLAMLFLRPLQGLLPRLRTPSQAMARRLQLAWWAVQAAFSLLPFALPRPGLAGEALFAVVASLFMLVEWTVKRQLTLAYFAFNLAFCLACAGPLMQAFLPVLGPAAVLMPMLVNGLLLAPRALALHRFGLDLYRRGPRAAMLAAGLLVAWVQAGPLAAQPIGAAALGWAWILAAAWTTDLLHFARLVPARLSPAPAGLAMLAVSWLVFALPGWLGAAAMLPMQALQAAVALCLGAGLLELGRSEE